MKTWDTPHPLKALVDPTLPTDIVFVMDKSGSMGTLANDTINGFNAFIAEQQKQPGEAFLTLVLFDTVVTLLAERKPLDEVPSLTSKEYQPGGMTALLDAVGNALARLEKNPPTGKVLFVVATDGEENSSREYKVEAIRATIEAKEKAGWGFVFLGANASTWQGANMGIQTQGVYAASAGGTRSMYSNLSANTSLIRSSSGVAAQSVSDANWDTGDGPKSQ